MSETMDVMDVAIAKVPVEDRRVNSARTIISTVLGDEALADEVLRALAREDLYVFKTRHGLS